MKFPHVKVENFLGIGEAEFCLDERGLILVQGINEDDPSADSNGSGKSSMIDAIFWCLYGATARDVSGDEVVNRVTGKNCIVTTTVIDGDNEAVITRWRKAKGFHKPSGVSIVVNGVDKTGGTDALTQAIINDFIGASQEVFSASVYAGQEVMPDIPSMSDRQLKTLIEEAAGITTIEQAYEVARARASEAKRIEAEANRAYQNQSDRVAFDLEANVTDMTQKTKDWEVYKNIKTDAAKKAVAEKVEEAKRYAADIKKIDVAKLEAEIKQLEGDAEVVRQQIAAIDNKIASVGKENDRRLELQRDQSEATAALNQAKRDLQRTIADYNRLKSDAENVNAKVGKPCGECGKPITEEDLAATVEAIKEKMKPLKKQATTEKANVEKLEAACTAKAKELEDYVANMTDTSAEVERKRALQSKLGGYEGQIRKRQETVGSVSAMRARLEALKDAAHAEKRRMDDLAKQENPYTDLLKKAREKLDEGHKLRAELEEQYQAASRRAYLTAAAAEVFGPKGVRAHILDTVTPFLNDRTSHYLSALSDGSLEAVWSTLTESKAGELKEKFSIGTTKYGSGSFKSLSGGEKRKVRLSTMLALQDLVASRASKPIELWVGDEIDNALDTAGLERLMTLLEMKAREKGTVLIVSHHDLADWCRDIVTVTMKGKIATVEGPICPTV